MRGVKRTKFGWTASMLKEGKYYGKRFRTKKEAEEYRLELEKKYGDTSGGSFEDLYGKTIGYWKIVGDTGKRKHNNIVYLCRNIKTGELKEITRSSLYRKNSGVKAAGIKTIREDNKTGYPNVYFYKNYHKWQVKIEDKHIGYFDKFEEAVKEAMKDDSYKEIIKNPYVLDKEVQINIYKNEKQINKLEKELKIKGYRKDGNRWRALVLKDGKKIYKSFKDEKTAKEARKDYIKTVVEPQIKQLKEIIKNDNI